MKRPLAYVTAAWRGGECEVMEQAAKYMRPCHTSLFCLFHGYDLIYKSMSPSRGQKNRAVTEHSPMVSGLDADKKEPSLRTSWEGSNACVCRCRCGRTG